MSDYYKLAAAKLDRDRYRQLQTMADQDTRNLSDQIRWLIDREWARRQQQARTLVDTPETYDVKES